MGLQHFFQSQLSQNPQCSHGVGSEIKPHKNKGGQPLNDVCLSFHAWKSDSIHQVWNFFARVASVSQQFSVVLGRWLNLCRVLEDLLSGLATERVNHVVTLGRSLKTLPWKEGWPSDLHHPVFGASLSLLCLHCMEISSRDPMHRSCYLSNCLTTSWIRMNFEYLVELFHGILCVSCLN